MADESLNKIDRTSVSSDVLSDSSSEGHVVVTTREQPYNAPNLSSLGNSNESSSSDASRSSAYAHVSGSRPQENKKEANNGDTSDDSEVIVQNNRYDDFQYPYPKTKNFQIQAHIRSHPKTDAGNLTTYQPRSVPRGVHPGNIGEYEDDTRDISTVNRRKDPRNDAGNWTTYLPRSVALGVPSGDIQELNGSTRDRIASLSNNESYYRTLHSERLATESKTPYGWRRYTKVICVIIVILICSGGIGSSIHFFRERHPDAFSGGIKDPVAIVYQVGVRLGERIALSEHVDAGSAESTQSVKITPPMMVNYGESLILHLGNTVQKRSEKLDEWAVRLDRSDKQLAITGPRTTCSSDGLYSVQLMDSDDNAVYNFTFTVTVQSEAGKASMVLQNQTFTNISSNDLELKCEMTFGCEKSQLDIVVVINDKDEPLEGIDYTTKTTYSRENGYTESTTKIVPTAMLPIVQQMKCGPKSKSTKESDVKKSKEKEAVLELSPLTKCETKDCDYKCTYDSFPQYYVVDPTNCKVFHRCVSGTLYTDECEHGTFFDSDPSVCACSHASSVSYCRPDGTVKSSADVSNLFCGYKPK